MAVNKDLVASGDALNKAEFLVPDIGKAITDGQKLITDQLENNIKMDRETEKHKWAQEAQEEIRGLRKRGKEKREQIWAGQKAVGAEMLQYARDNNLLPTMDWDKYDEDSVKWMEENKFEFLRTTDKNGKLAGQRANLIKAEDNWKANVKTWAEDSDISDSSEQAKTLQFAIIDYIKNNPDKTPMKSTDKHGRLIYLIPNPTSKNNEMLEVLVERMANATDPVGLFGDFKPATSFDASSASYKELNGPTVEKFQAGTATQDDVDNIGVWWDRQNYDDIAMTEQAETLALDGIELGDYITVDANEDGTIDGKDIDANQDGRFDAKEREVLKELFIQVELADPTYAEFQTYDKPATREDITNYVSLIDQYGVDGKTLKEGGTVSGVTADGKQFAVGWDEDWEHWYSKVDGKKLRIGGSDKSSPPNIDIIAGHIGVTPQQINQFKSDEADAKAAEKEAKKVEKKKIKDIVTKLSTNAQFALGTDMPNPANDPGGYKKSAWLLNGNKEHKITDAQQKQIDELEAKGVEVDLTKVGKEDYLEELFKENNVEKPEQTYESDQHRGLSKQIPAIKNAIKRFSNSQATACGLDAKGLDCKNATRDYEASKAKLVALEKKVEAARVKGIKDNAAKNKRAADAKFHEATLGAERLEAKQAVLTARGEDLNQEELTELEGYRKTAPKSDIDYSFDVDTSQGANIQNVDPKLLADLDDLVTRIGLPITITSGLRTTEVNTKEGGKTNSRHLSGNAVDVRTKGVARNQIERIIGQLELKGYTVIDEGDHLHIADKGSEA